MIGRWGGGKVGRLVGVYCVRGGEVLPCDWEVLVSELCGVG